MVTCQRQVDGVIAARPTGASAVGEVEARRGHQRAWPEPERGPVREEPKPEPEVRTPEQVMVAAAARPRPVDRDATEERERRDAERVDELLDDVDIVREHPATDVMLRPTRPRSRTNARLRNRLSMMSMSRLRQAPGSVTWRRCSSDGVTERRTRGIGVMSAVPRLTGHGRRIEDPAPRYKPPDCDNAH